MGRQSDDPLFRQQLVWQLATALGHTGAVERYRGRHERAKQYLANAITLRDALKSGRPMTVLNRYRRGLECFYLGSLYVKDNMREAQLWYNQARVQFPRDIPKSMTFELRYHGDRLVAMAVAYWNAGDRELAIKLTRSGIEKIELAVKRKLAKASALVIPYRNLSGMVRTQGDNVEADSLSERAATIMKLLK